MNKISQRQLGMILILNHLFSFICCPISFSLESVISYILSWILQGIILLIILRLRKSTDYTENILNNRAAAAALCAVFIYYISISFIQIRNVSESLDLPLSSGLISAAVIIVTCTYTSSLGIKALSRAGLILFSLFIAAAAVIAFGSYSQIQLSSLYLTENAETIPQMLFFSSYITEPVILFLLLPITKSSSSKGTAMYFIISFVIEITLMLLGILVLHRKMELCSYPFFALADVSQPLRVQRADAVYIIIFVMICIFKISLLAVIAAMLAGKAAGKLPCRIIFILSISAAVSFGIYFVPSLYGTISRITVTAAALLFIIILLCKNKGRVKNKA